MTAELVLTKKKEMDLFTLDGLTKQTGVDSNQWNIYIIKELIDNAIDVCESSNIAPCISVAVNDNGIKIQDNGPGISKELLNKIINLNIYAGSKYYYKRPTRGAQGNALLTILPMPYIISNCKISDCATIRSENKQFDISILHDDIKQDYQFNIVEIDNSDNNIKGTEIFIKIPMAPYQNPGGYKWMIESFASFNPHCKITADIFGASIINDKIGDITKMRSESESVHWYSSSAFRDLIYAYIRADQGDTTIKNFCMDRFRGISNSTKTDTLLNSMTSKRLEDLRTNEDDIRQLYLKGKLYIHLILISS